MRRHSREHGFSLIEMTVSMGLMIVVTGSIFALLNPGQGNFVAEPEVADMQQRTRLAADTLYKDLVMVGSGSYAGDNPMALSYFFAPVMPFRQGRLQDDPPGTFRTDAITLMMVPATTAQSTIAQPMPAKSAELKVTEDPNCPPSKADQLCGFKQGMSVLILRRNRLVRPVLDHPGPKSGAPSPAQPRRPGEDLRRGRQDRPDPESHLLPANRCPAKTYQLMHYDGADNDVPVVDNVVGLEFEYFGDPQPPVTIGKPLTNPVGPWTTYGPKPPLPWRPGELRVHRTTGRQCRRRACPCSGRAALPPRW